jgi:hypothetical protein
VPRKDTQVEKKDTTQAPKESKKGAMITQGTPLISTPQEQDQTKRLIIHTGGECKRAKVHKQPPKYTITEDDANLMAKRVQDQEDEEFEDAQHQRDRI